MQKIFSSLVLGMGTLLAMPAHADFTDNMTTKDPNVSAWYNANDWDNGAPFDTCWKSTQFSRNSAGLGVFTLKSGTTSCSGGTKTDGSAGPAISSLKNASNANGYYGYGTYSFNMKAAPAKAGVVMGAFTYRGPYNKADNNNPIHNEIDVEFLNGGVQFNYYHNHVGGHEVFLTAAQLGFDPSTSFHTYSYSWQPGVIKWMVDGVVKATQTTDIPTIAEGGMQIMVNLWKCTASAWCGVAPASINTTGYVDWISYTVK